MDRVCCSNCQLIYDASQEENGVPVQLGAQVQGEVRFGIESARFQSTLCNNSLYFVL